MTSSHVNHDADSNKLRVQIPDKFISVSCSGEQGLDNISEYFLFLHVRTKQRKEFCEGLQVIQFNCRTSVSSNLHCRLGHLRSRIFYFIFYELQDVVQLGLHQFRVPFGNSEKETVSSVACISDHRPHYGTKSLNLFFPLRGL